MGYIILERFYIIKFLPVQDRPLLYAPDLMYGIVGKIISFLCIMPCFSDNYTFKFLHLKDLTPL